MNSTDFDWETIVTAIGLLSVINSVKFQFCSVSMRHILGILKPVDQLLQKRETDLDEAMSKPDKYNRRRAESSSFGVRETQDKEYQPGWIRQNIRTKTHSPAFVLIIAQYNSQSDSDYMYVSVNIKENGS